MSVEEPLRFIEMSVNLLDLWDFPTKIFVSRMA